MSQEGYARMYAHGTSARKPWFHRGSLWVAEQFSPHLKVGKLLDVGCGPGHVAAWFKSDGHEVVAIDSDPHMIKECESLYGGMLSVKRLDARDVEFSREFDSITCIHDVINAFHPSHLPDVINRLFKALKPGGTLAFDLSTEAGLETWGEVQVQDKPDYFKIDRGTYNHVTKTATISITGFFQEKVGEKFSRFQATVDNYFHPIENVTWNLEHRGFQVSIYNSKFVLSNGNDEGGKVYFIARRS